MLLADVDMDRRRLRVIGKGIKEEHVPVDAAFFTELAAYLRWERPPGLATPQCLVVPRGPTTGAPVSEAGVRSLFRRHPGGLRRHQGPRPYANICETCDNYVTVPELRDTITN